MSIVRLVSNKESSPVTSSTTNESVSQNLENELSSLRKHLLPNIDTNEEIDYDEDGIGSEPEGTEIDL